MAGFCTNKRHIKHFANLKSLLTDNKGADELPNDKAPLLLFDHYQG